jgi:hypothetical protein
MFIVQLYAIGSRRALLAANGLQLGLSQAVNKALPAPPLPSGASAGSLIVACAKSGLPMSSILDASYVLAADCRDNGTRFRLKLVLDNMLRELLPEDIHHRYISTCDVCTLLLLYGTGVQGGGEHGRTHPCQTLECSNASTQGAADVSQYTHGRQCRMGTGGQCRMRLGVQSLGHPQAGLGPGTQQQPVRCLGAPMLYLSCCVYVRACACCAPHGYMSATPRALATTLCPCL